MPLVFVPGPTVYLVVLHMLLDKEEQQLVINIYNAGCSTFIAEEREAPEDWRAHTNSEATRMRPQATLPRGVGLMPWWYNM